MGNRSNWVRINKQVVRLLPQVRLQYGSLLPGKRLRRFGRSFASRVLPPRCRVGADRVRSVRPVGLIVTGPLSSSRPEWGIIAPRTYNAVFAVAPPSNVVPSEKDQCGWERC